MGSEKCFTMKAKFDCVSEFSSIPEEKCDDLKLSVTCDELKEEIIKR